MKSDTHKNLQTTIRDYHKKRGCIAILEYYASGKKIDVLVQNIKTKYTIAYEIQLTYKHFSENILLDFKAGCDEVRIICIDNKVLEQMRQRASSEVSEHLLRKTRFLHINDFIPHLKNKDNNKS